MKVTLKCAHCNIEFTKEERDYKLQYSRLVREFYCLKCRKIPFSRVTFGKLAGDNINKWKPRW